MRRLFILLFIVLLIGTGLFFWLRPDEGAAAVGPPVAFCPGPDLYGYTCADGTPFAYIDATQNSGLHQDDGAVQIPLPFTFTFYGTPYESVWAGTNGVLQFGGRNPRFSNACLDDGPVVDMGDMIAPYWDDFDLTFTGALEVETVGEAPDRIFVVEWDEVPPYTQPPEEAVTFSVQLHESSNDIVFLYPDTTTSAGLRGSSATVGLQSEAQALSLQYSCNQAVVGDASALHIRHPAEPPEEIGLDVEAMTWASAPVSRPALKGPPALLREKVGEKGSAALPTLRRHWLNQPRPLLFSWHWADLDGDETEELLGLWHGPAGHPEAAQVAVFSVGEGKTLGETAAVTPRFVSLLSTREIEFARPELIATQDLTGDGLADLLLQDTISNRVAAITFTQAGATLHHLAQVCRGAVALRDANGDGTIDLLRGQCGTIMPKTIYSWQSDHFARLRP